MTKISLFISVYFFILLGDGVAAARVQGLSHDGFNQSVNAGTEVALGIRYQRQDSYQLIEGDEPASKTGWESHSTLTTGLFPLRAGKGVRLSYVAKADGKDGTQPVLWTEIRYFDRHGVNVGIAGGRRQTVPSQWRKQTINLLPIKANIAYAEVWFIKYANGQTDHDEVDDNDYISAIYVSDIRLQ